MPPRTQQSRVDDLIRAETDISSIKKLLLQIAFVAFSFVIGGGVWVGTIANKVASIEKTTEDMSARQRADDLLGARLDIKLAAIEENLSEIKRGMK